ncbi:MAG: ParA family protein [Magnetospirillum sp.]|nr:ParA family protein [Magnetospirillum sp.]
MSNESIRPPAVVAVFNHKGGVAKTTTATNIAVCLAARGWRVVLIDLDPQGNATAGFGHTRLPPVGALDVVAGRCGFAECLLPTPFADLRLLPATEALRMAELELAGDETAVQLLRDHLREGEAIGLADMVVIDCPPSFGMVTLNALYAATAVLLPTRPDPYAHDGLLNSWYEIKRLRQEAEADVHVAGILLTMTEERGPLADGAQAIRAEFGQQVYPTHIPGDVAVAEAAQLSLPVVVLDPDGGAGRAYVAVTAELLARLHGDDGHADDSATDATLNTLREWRAEWISQERIPKQRLGWIDAEPSASPSAPSAAAAPGRSRSASRLMLGLAFSIGAILGVIVGAAVRGELM